MGQSGERPDAPSLCLVCGIDYGDYRPWGDDGTLSTFDICDCCGVEFGYQDSTVEAIRRFREQWIARGAPWRKPSARPDGWSLDRQLERLPTRVR